MKKRTVPILNSHPSRGKGKGKGKRPFGWVQTVWVPSRPNGRGMEIDILYGYLQNDYKTTMERFLHTSYSTLFLDHYISFIHSYCLFICCLVCCLVLRPLLCGTEPFTEPPIRTTATGTALGGGRRRLVGRCILHISPTKAEKESSPSIRITFGGHTGD
jgi:hypothetical protein